MDRGRGRRRAARSLPTARVHTRITERIGGSVAALQADLMGPFVLKWNKEIRVKGHATGRVDINLGHPSAYALGIELRVNRRIERIRDIHPSAVAADLEHLRTAVERAALRMGRVGRDSTQPHRPRQPRLQRIADIVLPQLAGAPARYVKKAIIKTERDLRNQRRNRFELFQRRRQQIRIGRFGRDLDYLAGLPLPVALDAPPDPDPRRQILRRDNRADKTVSLRGIVRWTQLERHLMLGTEIDLLQMAPPP